MERQIKILVVDDSAYNRRTISDMIEEIPGAVVVGTAYDGRMALKLVPELNPDIITLDLEMPIMDGFTFLRLMMSNFPTPTIVISSRDEDAYVFKALELGAVDFIAKPTHAVSTTLLNIKEQLHKKIPLAERVNLNMVNRSERAAPDPIPPKLPVPTEVGSMDMPVLAIGASTGGPPAIQTLLSGLSPTINAAVVISQHMPPGFTKSFAERLNKYSGLRVSEAKNLARLTPGNVLICPGGFHMTFKKEAGGNLVLLDKGKDDEDKYVPSIDRMFESAALCFGKNLVSLVMTGMGDDGKLGTAKVQDAGGYTLAQSEMSSVIPGMPREAISTEKVNKVLALDIIAEALNKMLDKEKTAS